ncbi:MAG: ribonuclease H-like domain-containing protein [Patescibacteria group bacterium]
MKDKIVIDIETKNTFADVGGQEFIHKLEASFVGVYSYNQDKYLSFKEGEWDKLAPILQNASMIVGFSINRFDLPVLAKYFNFNLMAFPRLDLLEEVEMAYGNRVGLDILAQTNLGIGKTHHGLDAIRFYQEGNWAELESYCLQDVKVTKDLYEFVKKNNFLHIPRRYSGELIKVSINLREISMPATLF